MEEEGGVEEEGEVGEVSAVTDDFTLPVITVGTVGEGRGLIPLPEPSRNSHQTQRTCSAAAVITNSPSRATAIRATPNILRCFCEVEDRSAFRRIFNKGISPKHVTLYYAHALLFPLHDTEQAAKQIEVSHVAPRTRYTSRSVAS